MEASPSSQASQPTSSANSPPRSPTTYANTLVNSQSSTNLSGLKPAKGLNLSPLALGPTVQDSEPQPSELDLDQTKKNK
jgi:hypothetical protein